MRKPYFSTLERNHELVKDLFGNTFYQKSIQNQLDVEEVVSANAVLSEHLLGKEVTRLIHERNVRKINEIMWSKLDVSFLRENEVIGESDNYGLIIIRPEAQWFEDEILKWLEERQIVVVEEKYSFIDFWLHWYIYFRNLYGFEDRCDFPTRILNFDHQKLCVLVVKAIADLPGNVKTFLVQHKGISGLRQKDTIRGDVAYHPFQMVIENSGKSLIKEARIALDPIGIYRKIATGELLCDNDFKRAEQPILFYVGLSIHIPDVNEYQKHKKAFLFYSSQSPM